MTGLEPTDYAATLEELKRRVHKARYAVQRHANVTMIALYWDIGRTLADRSANATWGANVVGQLSSDLRAEFPHVTGFSRRNLLYMRSLQNSGRTARSLCNGPLHNCRGATSSNFSTS